MKISTRLLIFLTVIWIIFPCACNRNGSAKNRYKTNTFYVARSGNDTNPGTIDQPWLTVKKANTVDLDPGDTLFFQGDQSFSGTLMLDSLDSGIANLNIVITSYGEGRAMIDGGVNSGLYADGSGYLNIVGIELKGNGRKEGNISDGVLMMNSRNIHLDRIDVHGFQHSGLHLHKCNNVRITNVYAHENGFAGIHVTGNTMSDAVNYDNQNLYIGNCVAENNPGDPTILNNHSGNGILASSVDGGIIEFCESFNNGWDMPWNGNGPVGIWIWDCTNFVIQHCISHDNKTHPGARDGGGFDLDGGVSNSVIQYCLSFNNQGTGFGLYEFGASKPWENNTIRYNISQNDGKTHDGSLGIWKAEGGTMRNCEIYNNTFYNNKGNIIWLDSSMPGFNFRNNVFIYNGLFLFDGHHFRHEVFQGNVYWNLSGGFNIEGYKTIEEWAKATGNEMVGGVLKGRFIDPMLVAPGTDSLRDPLKMSAESLSGYLLKGCSPLIDGGLDLNEIFGIDPGEMDFFGIKIPQAKEYDIGAVEYAGE